MKLNEKSTPAWIAIGHCHAMLGDNYGALTSYQKALTITPDSQVKFISKNKRLNVY